MLEPLNALPLASLMLVIAVGYLIGRVEVRGLALGPAGGTLGIALLAGFSGLNFPSHEGVGGQELNFGAIGFALFIYAIGFEAGPRFFDCLRGGLGWRLPAVGVLVNLLALGLAVVFGRLLGFGESATAGLLAGALTSAPTYAAAMDVADDNVALAVSFAITFPVGLIGMVWVAQVLPRWMGDDLAAGTSALHDDEDTPPPRPILRRAFEVRREEVIGRRLGELDLAMSTGCYIVHLHQGPRVVVPDGDTRLEAGDHVMAKGRLEQLQAFAERVGPEVYDAELRSRLPSPRAILVTESAVAGKTLRELAFFKEHGCLVTEVQRLGEPLEASADLALELGDIALVTGERDDVREVSRRLGRFERSSRETDLAIYAGGIFLGALLGSGIAWLFSLDRRVGDAIGLLTVGVLLGRFRRIGPFSAHVPPAAHQLMRDFGILLFVAETGTAAGMRAVEGIDVRAVPILLCAFLTISLPVAAAVLVGRRVLGLRPADAWGAACGGMTSSSALAVIRNAADSSEPAIGYAASYAVSSVLATLAGAIVVALV